ncbi:imidazole glycerol phosphate synthase subunit HisH [Pseudomonas sp. G11-1]|uniref:Imidazole glycerol phosphate synthase subunit HisH n=1 Tax=Halopseudomonas bauzanensis TaxID=653930 RepID=A0A031MFX5_9GAMM|nr:MULTISPECIES: imidazole glycerol phosphate synthase subunit HisH [Halopseudomonas]MCO5785768.1 imidazole glycerol phosphate synthase subunit HisH [Pseudomonas sp. G11-1]MCO5788128.1 imidazole glycerol phosphate synthase subunit HisH [Pseudomonas sp. G11-2]EZQ19487.1 imidazole glycerol phosphate synthase [Halopseudomonas bauzanensis]TKA93195.1 imidazole glycerol phosphate synthase subunit HisH [Halopseudomonas bauzanensis]WGK61353.1 imidazole glycerol phosphate synthase subunit HisH [Halopse
MSSVAVIDYGMGNLHSVAKALEHVGARQIIVTSDAQQILDADRVVLPGVGAIRDCINELRQLGLDQVVRQVASEKPLLGICVGMQMLLQRSEENGGVDALGLFPGTVKYFGDDLREGDVRLKVPHMGWNQVKQSADHPLWHRIEQDARFYFVHSYYASPERTSQLAGRCHYGVDFAAALAQDNVFATQFHPEKSHTNGLQLLQNFLAWDGRW